MCVKIRTVHLEKPLLANHVNTKDIIPHCGIRIHLQLVWGVHRHTGLIKHDIIQTLCIHVSEAVVHCLCHSMIQLYLPEILAGIKFVDFFLAKNYVIKFWQDLNLELNHMHNLILTSHDDN